MTKKINGLWLFGLSGSGKTFISKKIYQKKKRSVIIDGDVVRKKISFDLGYTIKDRVISTKRLLGISEILISQNIFPIVSSSYLGVEVSKLLRKKKFIIIKVIRNKKFLKKKVFNLRKNVVGKDIILPKINCIDLVNDKYINDKIKKIIELLK